MGAAIGVYRRDALLAVFGRARAPLRLFEGQRRDMARGQAYAYLSCR
jgi:hypothetical protein